jgi:hypothetical protein
VRAINELVDELDERMRRDSRRVNRWRLFHRLNGITFNLVLIVAPSILAVGLVSSESPQGRAILFAISVVGGINVTFKPYLHSQRRRSDMNAMRRLRDEFQGEMLLVDKDEGKSAEAFEKYSRIFSNIYELRGRELIDATLSINEQRELAEIETRERT